MRRSEALRIALFAMAAILAMPAFAQDARLKEMEILAQKVKADKKLVVSQAMQLTDAETKGFWPLYDGYQKSLAGINDRTAKLIVSYADAYNKGPVSDAVAKKLIAEFLAIEAAELKLKQDYAPRLEKALPVMNVARYLQIENKIRALIKYELASNIPLVQ